MARDEQHTHHWGSSLGIRPMALLHLPRAALLWTNSSDGDDLDNLFGPWPVTPSSLGPWPCYFLIYFACAALEFRLSPNLRIPSRKASTSTSETHVFVPPPPSITNQIAIDIYVLLQGIIIIFEGFGMFVWLYIADILCNAHGNRHHTNKANLQETASAADL